MPFLFSKARSRLRCAFRPAGAVAAASLATSLASLPARAIVVERVIAVVGDQAIFLSDLRFRERALVAQIYQRVPPGPQRVAYLSDMRKKLIERMVDERLEQIAAERAKVTVTPAEIDAGLQNIAGREKITVDALLAEVGRSGVTAQEYRDEVRRQLLEQKIMSLRVNQRIHVAPEDVRAGYFKLQRDERRALSYRPQWIVLRILPGSTPEAQTERSALARSLVAAARSGRDFGELASQYSDDSPTRARGGDIGMVKPGELAPQLEEVAFSLDAGEVSNPFVYGKDIVILRIAERDKSSLPDLAQAQDEVANRLYAEKRSKALRQWLDDFKKSVYVEVRYRLRG